LIPPVNAVSGFALFFLPLWPGFTPAWLNYSGLPFWHSCPSYFSHQRIDFSPSFPVFLPYRRFWALGPFDCAFGVVRFPDIFLDLLFCSSLHEQFPFSPSGDSAAPYGAHSPFYRLSFYSSFSDYPALYPLGITELFFSL